MRRFSSSNKQPLLPLNISHYSDAAPVVDEALALKAHSQFHAASMSENRHHTLIGFNRQQGYLQKSLQNLLDAQSEGLQVGLDISPGEYEVSPAEGDTPTSRPLNGEYKGTKGVMPVRQATSKKIGLRSARRGISRALDDLATLKTQEGEVMEAQLADTKENLTMVQGLISKKKGLEQQVQSIKDEEASRKIQEFKQEEKALDAEISILENRLWEMKARQRHLLGQIESLDNSVQSKLSSYEAALNLAEKEAQAFLARPKVHSSAFQDESESLWVLPIPRRTLEMASEHFCERRTWLKQRSLDIEIEKAALEEGAVIWEDVVAEITAVENSLREEMQRLPTLDASKRAEKNGTVDSMQTILKRMESAKSHIESQLTIAQKRQWRLVVCCIGAELEAIIQGYEVLEIVTSASRNRTTAEKNDLGRDRPPTDHESLGQIEPDPSNALKPGGAPARNPRLLDRSEDEDDEPGPELLISHVEDE